MPRRPGPPCDYYETYEMDREPREYRRHRDYEYDDYRRKSEPLVEDMARMGFRERPRREFMEGFERPIERDEMMPRRPREREMEMEMESPERTVPLGREDVYARPPRPRRRPRPREVEEDLASERASRRGGRRHPRDVEEDLFVEQRERHMNRRPRPDQDVEPDLFDEEERPRERRSRPRQMPDEEIIPDERERVDRMRRSVPDIEEEDFPIERERRRGVRRHPRDAEEDDFVFEEKEIRRGSRRHPERRSEEDLFEEDRERRRGSARHPERRSEDDLLYEKREKRHRRRRPEREFEEDIVEEPRHMGRRRRPEDEIEEEEVFMRRREDEPPLRRGWDSERDMRAHERARDFEDERYTRPRPRPPPGRRVEVEEEILPAEPPPDRHRIPVDPIDPSEGEFEEEMTTRWKGKGGRPAKIPEEEVTMRGRRERRRSSPSEDLTREMRGLRRDRRAEALDKGPGPHSHSDSSSRARDIIVDEEEMVVRKPKKIEIPPSPPSPPIEPIRVPPIPKEVPFPSRHIDEYDEPRLPTPELRPLRGSPNKIEIPPRRMRGGRSSEEDIILTRRDSEESLAPEDSISPTGQAVPEIFSDPWGDKKPVKPHARPKARIVESESESDESDSDSEPPFNPRGYPMPSMPPMPPMPPMPKMPSIPPMRDTKDTDAESTRTGNRTSKGTDDWSVVQSPPKPESVEMSGALNVVEVEPRHAPEPDTGRVAQQVTDAKDPRDDRWTEITKKLVVKDAIEQMGYEYEETRSCYFIFSYLTSDDIDELVELSDEIRSARRRRIRDMQRERSSYPPPAPPFRTPRMGMPGPPRARMAEKRMQDMRDRDWVYDRRR
ncbi:unnamed protein product [Penicillium olsonii]|nr:unnamed protein product [Penicillium olsonii]CAG7927486.1 unnamed protein product [Penicillium olsonii]